MGERATAPCHSSQYGLPVSSAEAPEWERCVMCAQRALVTRGASCVHITCVQELPGQGQQAHPPPCQPSAVQKEGSRLGGRPANPNSAACLCVFCFRQCLLRGAPWEQDAASSQRRSAFALPVPADPFSESADGELSSCAPNLVCLWTTQMTLSPQINVLWGRKQWSLGRREKDRTGVSTLYHPKRLVIYMGFGTPTIFRK